MSTSVENSLYILTRRAGLSPMLAQRTLADILTFRPGALDDSEARMVAWRAEEIAAGIDPYAPVHTVPLSTLFSDGCNFRDNAFRAWVDTVIHNTLGDGIEWDALGDDGYDDWEVVPHDRYTVESVFVVEDGYGFYQEAAEGDPGAAEVFVIREDGGICDDIPCGFPDDEYEHSDGASIPFFWDESEAEDCAEECNRDSDAESRYGHPWAHCMAYEICESWKDMAIGAGYRVAYHNPTQRWYCGVDGGGYSFDVHRVAFALAYAGERGVPTDYGCRVFVKGA